MIVRWVHMHFKPEEISTFLTIFEESKTSIRNFEGCHSLRLVQDMDDLCSIDTLSIWESEDHLNAYRNSPLFQETWAKTKILFDRKPEAHSHLILQELN